MGWGGINITYMIGKSFKILTTMYYKNFFYNTIEGEKIVNTRGRNALVVLFHSVFVRGCRVWGGRGAGCRGRVWKVL